MRNINEEDFYTKTLQNINNLRKEELCVETINKLRYLYNDLESIKNQKESLLEKNENDKLRTEVNGLAFLMNQIRTTFFFMVREHNISSTNGGIRRLANVLTLKNILIDDMLTVNNHAVIIEEVKYERYKTFLIDDYLKEITNNSLQEYDKKAYLSDKMNHLQEVVIAKINEMISELGLIIGYTSSIDIMNHKIWYKKDDFHIYISHKLTDMYDVYYGHGSIDIELFIENDNKDFYIFNMNVQKGKIAIQKENAVIWRLSDDHSKILNKTLESYTVRR